MLHDRDIILTINQLVNMGGMLIISIMLWNISDGGKGDMLVNRLRCILLYILYICKYTLQLFLFRFQNAFPLRHQPHGPEGGRQEEGGRASQR
jgi:hypothetical protein